MNRKVIEVSPIKESLKLYELCLDELIALAVKAKETRLQKLAIELGNSFYNYCLHAGVGK